MQADSEDIDAAMLDVDLDGWPVFESPISCAIAAFRSCFQPAMILPRCRLESYRQVSAIRKAFRREDLKRKLQELAR
jgi:hypothetical protein